MNLDIINMTKNVGNPGESDDELKERVGKFYKGIPKLDLESVGHEFYQMNIKIEYDDLYEYVARRVCFLNRIAPDDSDACGLTESLNLTCSKIKNWKNVNGLIKASIKEMRDEKS